MSAKFKSPPTLLLDKFSISKSVIERAPENTYKGSCVEFLKNDKQFSRFRRRTKIDFPVKRIERKFHQNRLTQTDKFGEWSATGSDQSILSRNFSQIPRTFFKMSKFHLKKSPPMSKKYQFSIQKAS